MSVFNLPIDPDALAQAIYDDETLLFRNYFSGMKRSLPIVTLPEIIGSNRTFQLNTVDRVTCTPRRFRVVAGAKEPDVKVYMNAIDPDEIHLEPDILGILRKPDSEVFQKEWDLKEFQLNLDNPMVLNEVITIVHLRQIALHIWNHDQLHQYFKSVAALGYVMKALFYDDVSKGEIHVELDNFQKSGPLTSNILYYHKPMMYVTRKETVIIPQWFGFDSCAQEGYTLSDKFLAKIAGVVVTYCKIERAFLLNEPLE